MCCLGYHPSMSDPIYWVSVVGAACFAWASGFAVMSMGSIRTNYALHWALNIVIIGCIGVSIWRGGWFGAITILLAYISLRQGGLASMRAYKNATGRLHPDTLPEDKALAFDAEYRRLRSEGLNSYEATHVAQSVTGYYGYGDIVERTERIDGEIP